MKKTGLIILGVIAILFVMLISTFIGTFNNLQTMDENINAKWAQVENQLKRRNNLIPNLVSTVKGYASHEKEVFSNTELVRSENAAAVLLVEKYDKSRMKNVDELVGKLTHCNMEVLGSVLVY